MEKAPCYGCEDKFQYCHSYCKAYKEWKSKYHDMRYQLNSQLNPQNCGYFKAKNKSLTAKASKHKYK